MSEDGDKEGGGWFDKLAERGGLLHSGVEMVEGYKATGEAIETAEEAMAPNAGGYAPALVAPEVAGAAVGFPELGQTVDAAQGAAEEGGGILGPLAKGLAPAALLSGVMGGYKSIKNMDEHGANLENSPELFKSLLETTSGGIGTLGLGGSALTALGATEAGAGATAAAAAAAPVAMVAGAGAGGMAIGDGMAHAADSKYTKTGAWGKDDGGSNKSAMDWGAGWGTWVDTHTGDRNAASPSILGGVAAGAGGIVGGIAGTAQAGWNGLKSLW